MVRTICLGEKDHAFTMLRSLKQMKHEKDLCDFIIKVGSDEYPTHKNILSAGSPYFKAMFKNDMIENRDGKVEMKEVDSECVKSCIDLMYSGSFDIPDGKIDQLLHVAIMLQLDKVKKAVSDVLLESLNTGNFYETRDIAEVYNLHSVLRTCKIYYYKNIISISSQPRFQKEKKGCLINILKSKNVKLSEEAKMTVSLRWVGENPKKKGDLFELIKLLKLTDISSGYLRDLLERHHFISDDFTLYKLVNTPLVTKVENSNNIKSLIVTFDNDADYLRFYDPETEKVTKFYNDRLHQLSNFSVVSNGWHFYILCEDKSVHRLDIRDGSSKWKRMQDMIARHGSWPSAVALSGSLFVIGNSGYPNRPTNIAETFDTFANRWLKLNAKPQAICNTTLVSINDSVFCVGGSDGSGPLNSFCKYSPSSSEWVDLEPMKIARYACGAAAVTQRIFVMGGWRGVFKSENNTSWGSLTYERLDELECYDVTSSQWTSLSQTIAPHSSCVAHHVNGWIYLVSRLKESNEVEKYDIANDRWVQIKLNDHFKIHDSALLTIDVSTMKGLEFFQWTWFR